MVYNPPTLTGETVINNGRPFAVEEYESVELGLGVKVRTGNGDDGIGVTMWWVEPIESLIKLNLGVEIAGEKVSGEAEILGLDAYGTPLDSSGSLLASQAFVINPDLFDPLAASIPDRVLTVTTGAPEPSNSFGVVVFAKPADQTFTVERGPSPPDQTYQVQTITKHDVFTAQPPFIVTVFAKPADQIFDVIVGPLEPDQTFYVTRGPSAATQVFDVKVIKEYEVTVQIEEPNETFVVTVGADPPPNPDQIFDVSVGGPDAPPIPTPDATYVVTTGPGIPDQTFTVLTVDKSYAVTVGLAPFVVTVGPESPNAIFNVTTGPEPSIQTFEVTTGPIPADQIFDVTTVRFFDVQVYDNPVNYTVTAPSNSVYRFNGGGLIAADNPSLTATVGQLLRFNVAALTHNFWICDTEVTGGCQTAETPAWAMLLENNGEDFGQVRVRFATPGTYYYNCEIHSSMRGTITVT